MINHRFLQNKGRLQSILCTLAIGVSVLWLAFPASSYNPFYEYKPFDSIFNKSPHIIYGKIIRNTETSGKPAFNAIAAQNHWRSVAALPKLTSNTKTSSSQTLNNFLANEAYQLGTALGSNNRTHHNIQDYLGNRLNQYITTAFPHEVGKPIEGQLSQYGNIEINAQVGEDWQLDQFELDYFIPLSSKAGSVKFTQMGARQWHDRTIINIGAGFRELNPLKTYMFGVNSFLDSDLTGSHFRMSTGVEAATQNFRFFSNYYFPLSGWKDQNVKHSGYQLQARAAKGYDIALTGFLPTYPALSGTINYTHWQSQHADSRGDLHLKNTGPLFANLQQSGIDYSIQWKPIPLVELVYGKKFTDDSNSTMGHVSVKFKYNFDQSLSKQLSPISPFSANMLDDMMHAMTHRNHNLVLDYKAKQTSSSIADLSLVKQQVNSIEQAEQITLAPVEINSAIPVIKYRWIGMDPKYFGNVNELQTTFIAPKYKSNGNNQYHIQLEIIQEGGTTVYSEKAEINVIKGNIYNTQLKLYRSANKNIIDEIDQSSDIYYFSQLSDSKIQKIYWSLHNERTGSNSKLDYCEQKNNCTYEWQQEQRILLDPNSKYPTINNTLDLKPGIYKATLLVTPLFENEVEIEIPIEIQANDQPSDIQWYNNDQPITKICRPYNPDSESDNIVKDIRAYSKRFQNIGIITYSSSNTAIATANEEGIKITGYGSTYLTATHSTENHEFTKNSAALLLETDCELEEPPSITWHSDTGINNSQLTSTKEYEHLKSYETTLTVKNVSADSITYRSSNKNVAFTQKVSTKTSEVKLVNTGTTYITATYFHNGAQFSHSYELIVKKGDHPLLIWDDTDNVLEGDTVTFAWLTNEQNTFNLPIKTGLASDGFGTGQISYYIKNSDHLHLVTLDDKIPGQVKVNYTVSAAENLEICAIQTADKNYNQSEPKCYHLIVPKATPKLEWDNDSYLIKKKDNEELIVLHETHSWVKGFRFYLKAISQAENLAPIRYRSTDSQAIIDSITGEIRYARKNAITVAKASQAFEPHHPFIDQTIQTEIKVLSKSDFPLTIKFEDKKISSQQSLTCHVKKDKTLIIPFSFDMNDTYQLFNNEDIHIYNDRYSGGNIQELISVEENKFAIKAVSSKSPDNIIERNEIFLIAKHKKSNAFLSDSVKLILNIVSVESNDSKLNICNFTNK